MIDGKIYVNFIEAYKKENKENWNFLKNSDEYWIKMVLVMERASGMFDI